MPSTAPGIALFVNGDRGIAVGKALTAAGIQPRCLVWHGSKIHDPHKSVGLPHTTTCLHMKDRSDQGWDAVSALLRSIDVDVGLVSGFSYILPTRVLEIPRHGFLNLHAGAVPGYRGGSPLNWQIANGETHAGLSILRMTSGIDDGPVVDSAVLPIDWMTTISDLHRQANEAFPMMVLRTLLDLERSLANALPQDEQDARYWHQRSDLDARFDPRLIRAAELDKLVRASTRPYPGAWALVGNQQFRIFAARPSDVSFCGTPGRVVKLGEGRPVLVMSDGALEILDYRLGDSQVGLRNGMHVV